MIKLKLWQKSNCDKTVTVTQLTLQQNKLWQNSTCYKFKQCPVFWRERKNLIIQQPDVMNWGKNFAVLLCFIHVLSRHLNCFYSDTNMEAGRYLNVCILFLTSLTLIYYIWIRIAVGVIILWSLFLIITGLLCKHFQGRPRCENSRFRI